MRFLLPSIGTKSRATSRWPFFTKVGSQPLTINCPLRITEQWSCQKYICKGSQSKNSGLFLPPSSLGCSAALSPQPFPFVLWVPMKTYFTLPVVFCFVCFSVYFLCFFFCFFICFICFFFNLVEKVLMVTRGLKHMDKNPSWKSSLGLRVLWGEMGKYEPLQHSRIMAGVGVCMKCCARKFCWSFPELSRSSRAALSYTTSCGDGNVPYLWAIW